MMRKVLIAILLGSALTLSSKAIDLSAIATLPLGDLSKQFVTVSVLPLPPNFPPITALAYGHPKYGYFETDSFRQTRRQLHVKLIPPGYRHSTTFLVRTKTQNQWQTIGKAKFRSPVPQLLQSGKGKLLSGNFSSAFFLGVGAFGHSGLNRLFPQSLLRDHWPGGSYFYIVNRLGEIVWLHFMGRGRKNWLKTAGNVGSAKQIAKGTYLLMAHSSLSRIEVVDYTGSVLHRVSPKLEKPSFEVHHDFIFLGPNRVLSLSRRRDYVRFAKRVSPVVRMDLWTEPTFWSFVSDTLVEINLETKRQTVRWNAIDFLNPLVHPAHEKDYTHTNSIDWRPGDGFLLSVRNLNMLVFVSEDFQKVKWKLGCGKSFDYSLWNKDCFYQQHHATFINRDQLLVFDNAQDGNSRILKIQLDRQKKTAKVVNSYVPSPQIDAFDRGSAHFQPGAVTGYFVQQSPKNYLVEFDSQTGKERARMEFSFDTKHVGYRAKPIDTIGPETYLGMTL